MVGKIFGGTKSSRGGGGGAPKTYKGCKKPIRKTKKKWRPFLLFVLETVKIFYFVGAPNITAGLGAVYKGRPANGEGVVLKFRTFPDGGRGWFVKVRTSENF